jgi:hypothetical protein
MVCEELKLPGGKFATLRQWLPTLSVLTHVQLRCEWAPVQISTATKYKPRGTPLLLCKCMKVLVEHSPSVRPYAVPSALFYASILTEPYCLLCVHAAYLSGAGPVVPPRAFFMDVAKTRSRLQLCYNTMSC